MQNTQYISYNGKCNRCNNYLVSILNDAGESGKYYCSTCKLHYFVPKKRDINTFDNGTYKSWNLSYTNIGGVDNKFLKKPRFLN